MFLNSRVRMTTWRDVDDDEEAKLQSFSELMAKQATPQGPVQAPPRIVVRSSLGTFSEGGRISSNNRPIRMTLDDDSQETLQV